MCGACVYYRRIHTRARTHTHTLTRTHAHTHTHTHTHTGARARTGVRRTEETRPVPTTATRDVPDACRESIESGLQTMSGTMITPPPTPSMLPAQADVFRGKTPGSWCVCACGQGTRYVRRSLPSTVVKALTKQTGDSTHRRTDHRQDRLLRCWGFLIVQIFPEFAARGVNRAAESSKPPALPK